MKTHLLFTLLGILLLVLSCDSPLKDNGQALEPLNGKLFISIRDGHPDGDGSTPRAVLVMETVKAYPCFNYVIMYDPYIFDNQLGFALKGTTIGSICLTAFGPATLAHPLEVQGGTYSIQISMNNVIGTHTFVVTDSAYYLQDSSNISTPRNTISWRMQPQTFSYHCSNYADMDDRWVCQGFLDTLQNYVPLTEFYQPEEGEWPYYYNGRYFSYVSESDFATIETVLKEFSKKYLTHERSATISIVNWRNEHLGSWILKNQ